MSETQDSILKRKNNIVIPITEDLSTENNSLLKTIFESNTKIKEELNYTNPKLKNVILTRHDERYIIYLVIKKQVTDKINYSDLFETILILKEVLTKQGIDSFSLPKLGKEYGLSWPQIRSMIRFIFKNTNININIHYHVFKTPQSEDIPKILEENHSLPHSGHFGFHKTYKKN